MASAAQIEANRRNAQKSTGPRTAEGKNRSRLNALDHGGRAMLPVLPNEQSGEYETQSHEWKRSIRPRNASEELLVDRLVTLDLQAKRIDRAQTARLTKRMYFGLFEEDAREEAEVIELGLKLFRDASGPQALHLPDEVGAATAAGEARRISDSSPAENHPMQLVHALQSTEPGCQWLLEQWAALRDLLEREVPWLASDQLKAVRLLGRNPLDAVDYIDVARVYLASHVLLNQGGQPFQEILNELSPDESAKYENDLKLRQYGARAPKDSTAARQMLLEIIGKATVALEDKADVYRELAAINVHTAGNRLSWDDTAEGEKLRRYELTCKRAWHRTFDLLMKLRRSGEELDFATVASLGRPDAAINMVDLDAPAPSVANVITSPSRTVDRSESPNEAKSGRENAPNEPNSRVPAPSREYRHGDKAFRIDPPEIERNIGGGGITGEDQSHPAFHRLGMGQQSPLLNLSPIFGNQC